MTTRPAYQPIDCALHDRLEAAATLRRGSDLAYLDPDGRAVTSRETIVDVFARAGEEFLKTASGLELRLDRVVALDGTTFQGDSVAGPKIVLETERLVLREIALDDAEFVLALTNEPSFLQFIGDKGIRTVDDACTYISNGPLESYRRYGYGLSLVTLKEGGVAIGTCGILKKDWLEDPDIGYAFLPPYWGRGYALEAAASVLACARSAWRLDRIVAVVTKDNDASIRLLGKLGLRFERSVTDPHGGEELALYA